MGTKTFYDTWYDLYDGEYQVKLTFEEVTCKFCGSRNLVRYGHYKDKQQWWCKDCQRKFVENNALPRMKTPTEQIASALSSYYDGMSLTDISRHLGQIYNNYPSDSTIYSWITKYTKTAVDTANEYRPKVGDTWIADETVLKLDGKNVWFWDIIDSDTRFLLASHISLTRTINDAKELVEKAATKADKSPKVIITDKLASYVDGIELAFGADTKHIQGKPFISEDNTNLIERFHGSLKDRTKVMRGLQNKQTAKLFLDGWLFYYNFLRVHESLKGKTPAEKAGIKFPYLKWTEVVNKTSKDNIIDIEKISVSTQNKSGYRYRKYRGITLGKRPKSSVSMSRIRGIK